MLWKYLFGNWCKIFFLALLTFALFLIIARFQEIARFAALSGKFSKVTLFSLFQLPFILPLAIPISALLASFLLSRRLSASFEWIALRASGISLLSFMTPILFAALFASLAHFAICANVAPFFGNKTKKLLYQETSSNPILLLQRQNLVKLKNSYLNLEVKEKGTKAENFLLVTRNPKTGRLSLFSAEELTLEKELLTATNLALLSHIPSHTKKGEEALFMENQKSASLKAPLLTIALKKHRPRVESSLLSLKMLLLRAKEGGKQSNGAKVEILRRLSLTLSILPFSLVGLLFGLNVQRVPSKKGLFLASLFLVLFLFCYLAVRECKEMLALAFFLAFAPHLLMLFSATKRIHSLQRGTP